MRKAKTAEELMLQLQSDIDYQKKIAEKKERLKKNEEEFKEAEQPILKDLLGAGYEVSSLDELVNTKTLLPDTIIQVLLKWLPQIKNNSVLEMTVRSVSAAQKNTFNGSVLTEIFERTTSDNIRWVISNAIASSLPFGIAEWVVKAIQNKSYGYSREMLCDALVKLVSPEESRIILTSIYDQLPIHATVALGKVGDELTMVFLESKNREYKDKIKKEQKGSVPYNILNTTMKEINKALMKMQKKGIGKLK